MSSLVLNRARSAVMSVLILCAACGSDDPPAETASAEKTDKPEKGAGEPSAAGSKAAADKDDEKPSDGKAPESSAKPQDSKALAPGEVGLSYQSKDPVESLHGEEFSVACPYAQENPAGIYCRAFFEGPSCACKDPTPGDHCLAATWEFDTYLGYCWKDPTESNVETFGCEFSHMAEYRYETSPDRVGVQLKRYAQRCVESKGAFYANPDAVKAVCADPEWATDGWYTEVLCPLVK
jgi:hypothetical protein